MIVWKSIQNLPMVVPLNWLCANFIRWQKLDDFLASIYNDRILFDVFKMFVTLLATHMEQTIWTTLLEFLTLVVDW